jgi:hypothetical protein
LEDNVGAETDAAQAVEIAAEEIRERLKPKH